MSSVVTPEGSDVYRDLVPPVVEIRESWSDPWVQSNEIEAVSCSYNVPSHGLDHFSFRHRYGEIKHPWENDYSNRTFQDWNGWWVRVRLRDPDDPTNTDKFETIFVGKAESESRTVHGSPDVDSVPSGIQEYTAYGPYNILRKTEVYESEWMVYRTGATGTYKRQGWLPDINLRDKRGTLIGNMSAVFKTAGGGRDSYHVYDAGAYGTGGGLTPSIWSSNEYARYLFEEFLNDDASPDNPLWTLGSSVDTLLADVKENVTFNDVESIADMLHAIIPRRLGLDFFIVYTDAGFEVEVVSLTSTETTFGSGTIPANTDVLEIDATASLDAELAFEKSSTQKYGKIQIIGQRAILCGSFDRNFAGLTETGEVHRKWNSGDAGSYDSGTGTPSDTDLKHDTVRADDRFRHVYQAFGLSVDRTDLPTIDIAISDEGVVTLAANNDEMQPSMRETLPYLPLREDYDYTVDPPINNSISFYEPAYLPPQAFVEHLTGEVTPVDKVGVGISLLPNDWGLLLQSSPNHLIASSEFTGSGSTQQTPQFDSTNMSMIIAFESNRRLVLTHEEASAELSDGTKTIYMDDAALWLLLPDTIVGQDTSLAFVRSPGSLVTLRNDFDRMQRVMAGAITRYTQNRYRANLRFRGLKRWSDRIGHMLRITNDGTDLDQVEGVLTSIEWMFESSHQTVLRGGYADQ